MFTFILKDLWRGGLDSFAFKLVLQIKRKMKREKMWMHSFCEIVFYVLPWNVFLWTCLDKETFCGFKLKFFLIVMSPNILTYSLEGRSLCFTLFGPQTTLGSDRAASLNSFILVQSLEKDKSFDSTSVSPQRSTICRENTWFLYVSHATYPVMFFMLMCQKIVMSGF